MQFVCMILLPCSLAVGAVLCTCLIFSAVWIFCNILYFCRNRKKNSRDTSHDTNGTKLKFIVPRVMLSYGIKKGFQAPLNWRIVNFGGFNVLRIFSYETFDSQESIGNFLQDCIPIAQFHRKISKRFNLLETILCFVCFLWCYQRDPLHISCVFHSCRIRKTCYFNSYVFPIPMFFLFCVSKGPLSFMMIYYYSWDKGKKSILFQSLEQQDNK